MGKAVRPTAVWRQASDDAQAGKSSPQRGRMSPTYPHDRTLRPALHSEALRRQFGSRQVCRLVCTRRVRIVCVDRIPDRMAARTVLKIVYNHEVLDEGVDPVVHLVETALESFAAAISPGWLVDVAPSRKWAANQAPR
jgi:hypothetical protein